MSWKALAVWAAAAAIGLALPAAGAARAKRTARVPFGFVGMNADYPVWPNPGVDIDRQLDVMVGSGVESVRAVIDWSRAQPYAPGTAAPDGYKNVDGVPTDFTDVDALVAQTAQRGLNLLPVVINAPQWDGHNFRGQVMAPVSPQPYAAFLKALVQRYGPNGEFWQENPQYPKRPVDMWQIWNEPNIWSFWPQGPQPWYQGYIPLLRAAHDAVKRADPGAKVVLAGLPNYSWINLRQLIRHGGRNLFDMVDVHPYTLTPRGVVTILGHVRQVLNRYHRASTPLIAGEISWPSSEGKGAIRVGFNIGTTEAGQARKIGTVMPLLARYRRSLRLAGFYYYNWAGQEQRGAEAFDFSGLFRYSGAEYRFYAKPAYNVFKARALALEDCRAKGAFANQCLQ